MPEKVYAKTVARALQKSRLNKAGAGRTLSSGRRMNLGVGSGESQHSRKERAQHPTSLPPRDVHAAAARRLVFVHRSYLYQEQLPHQQLTRSRLASFRNCATSESHHELSQSSPDSPNSVASSFTPAGDGVLRCMASLRGAIPALLPAQPGSHPYRAPA
jgi:hypothetical protein